MFDPLIVILIVCLFMGGLFLLALWTERKASRGVNLVNNPLIYSLSLGVYCTTWTFYGGVGMAAHSGTQFLATYLGSTLGVVFWWIVLRKMIRIRNEYHITSIADFISARYNKSQAVAALASVITIVGIGPYIALQLKAVFSSFGIITTAHVDDLWIANRIGPIMVLLMVLFTIMFGVRRLDPTERHQGMVMAVAVESIVKLAAMLAVGIFVVYFLYNGIGDIFSRLPQTRSATEAPGSTAFLVWTTNLLLALSAIFLLPRQFHIAVVENFNERHVLKAMWMFPLYMMLITFFIYPIAAAGIAENYRPEFADMLLLQLPLDHGMPYLSLLVFIGGFAAAAGMVMVCSVTMATMFTNHLLLPIVDRMPQLRFLRRNLLACRWFAVAAIIFIGYGFVLIVGKSYMLVSMGTLSFAAVLQFAPAMLGGLYWRRGSRLGALLGMSGGFLVWLYTLLLPAIVKSGWISNDILTRGPFGISLLRPEHLFGMTLSDPIAHGVFWSFFFNVTLYVIGSLYVDQSDEERTLADAFANALHKGRVVRTMSAYTGGLLIDLAEKSKGILDILGRYFPREHAHEVLRQCLGSAGIGNKDLISPAELVELIREIEKALAGAIGSSAAHHAVQQGIVLAREEQEALRQVYSEVIADLKLTPADLKSKIDFYQERSALLTQQALEFKTINEQLSREISDRKKTETDLRQAKQATDEMLEKLVEANERLKELDKMKTGFLSSMSHEMRTPMTSVIGFLLIVRSKLVEVVFPSVGSENAKALKAAQQIEQNIDIILTEAERLLLLINDVLDIAKLESGNAEWKHELVSASTIVDTATASVAAQIERKGLALFKEIDEKLPEVMGDAERLARVMENLLSNAIKFTDTGSVTCSVKQDGHELIVGVRDTGIGISRENCEKVFETFTQIGDLLTGKPKGTGLGLSICRRIVEHHGGRIWAESSPGKGSAFIFTIPINKPEILQERHNVE